MEKGFKCKKVYDKKRVFSLMVIFFLITDTTQNEDLENNVNNVLNN